MSPPSVTIQVTKLPKKLDETTSEQLGLDVQALADEAAELHLDFSEVDYLTSAALARIVSLHKRTRLAGRRLVLVNVKELPYEVLDVTRLNSILDVRRMPD